MGMVTGVNSARSDALQSYKTVAEITTTYALEIESLSLAKLLGGH